MRSNEKRYGGQSNFGDIIQTDAKDSKFTVIPLSIFSPFSSISGGVKLNATYLSEVEGNKIGKAGNLEMAFLFASTLYQMLNARVLIFVPKFILRWSGWKSCSLVFNEMVLRKTVMPFAEISEKMKK